MKMAFLNQKCLPPWSSPRQPGKTFSRAEQAMVLENNNFYVMKEVKAGTFEKVKCSNGKKIQ